MPCIYNPITGEVETLYERYQREYEIEQRFLQEYTLDDIMLQQSIEEKIDILKGEIKHATSN